MERVILLSTGCPKCRILESKLKQKSISYETISDIDTIMSKGYMELPILEVETPESGVVSYKYADALKWVNNRG